MAASSDISLVNITPGLSGNLVALQFTKAGATDTIAVPAGYGSKVVWCNVVKESTGVPDPATGISNLTVTLSVGTGVMRGLFLVE